eukprot:1020879-Pleurochrysis_carterae.AAC.2
MQTRFWFNPWCRFHGKLPTSSLHQGWLKRHAESVGSLSFRRSTRGSHARRGAMRACRAFRLRAAAQALGRVRASSSSVCISPNLLRPRGNLVWFSCRISEGPPDE